MKNQNVITVKRQSELSTFVKNVEQLNDRLKHENLGFLSLSSGFMPKQTPIDFLPPTFSAWDEIAAKLPLLYKQQNITEAINQLPDLSSQTPLLEDKYLLRASLILSFLAHSYVRSSTSTTAIKVPDTITNSWKIISDRLARPAPFMSYIDLIVYNYRLLDPNKKFEVENLDLLIPIIGNQEERVFYLVQTEILHKATTILQAIVYIHDAMLIEDDHAIEMNLDNISKCLKEITYRVFPKINPNATSKTYVDPVIWAKTVAPFAVPIDENIQGPSGTSSPMFHLLDTFLERHQYQSELGKEALLIREWYPIHWRGFLSLISKSSFKDYVKKRQRPSLDKAYANVLTSYSGKGGFLEIHKRKVYAYLQTAFKVGRDLTIGGFQGAFDDRTWEEVDDALEESKSERRTPQFKGCPFSGRKIED